MNPFCIDLKFDIDPLNTDITKFPKVYWNTIPFYFLNVDLLNFFSYKNLKVTKAALFYSNGHSVHPIHHDYLYLTDFVKLNWVYGENHIMNWYSTDIQKPPTVGKTDRNYVYYDANEVRLVHKQKIGCPSLCQVGVPHNVENFSGIRYCISIGLFNKDNKPITMTQASELFKEYIQ